MDKTLDLRDAVFYLGLNCDPRKNTGTLICPVCGRKTLRINFAKGIYNCPACEEVHGGILDFWALYRGLPEVYDKREKRIQAAKDFYQYVDNKMIIPQKEFNYPEIIEKPMASLKERDKAYSKILQELSLNDKHKADLIRRGLSEKDIAYWRIKTAPTSQLRMVLKKISQSAKLEGIPGLYKDKDGFKSIQSKGYLIPQMDISGEIQGCQIRLDNPKDGGKFISYSSSGKPEGTGSAAFIHTASKDYYNLDAKNVIITEGPLKANIINHYTDFTVLSVPGVNSLSRLPEVLSELKYRGNKKLYIAYDMDYKNNPYVMRGLDKLKKMISDSGINYSQIMWEMEKDGHNLKGYDDYLQYIAG